MPINTNIEKRMKCFGHISEMIEDDCQEECCFIEMDLCAQQEKKKKTEICRESAEHNGWHCVEDYTICCGSDCPKYYNTKPSINEVK